MFCTVQGFIVQFFTLSTVTLTMAVGFNLYLYMCKRKDPALLDRYESKYFFAAFGAPPPRARACVASAPMCSAPTAPRRDKALTRGLADTTAAWQAPRSCWRSSCSSCPR